LYLIHLSFELFVTAASLQEIVACMAYPVAGLPHQYVMERAIAAEGLDCRYLTLEVAPEDLEIALNGARACGILGVSLGEMHQQAAGAWAEGLTGDAQWLQHVDLITWRDKVATSEYTWGEAVALAMMGLGSPVAGRIEIWGEGVTALAVAVALSRHGLGPVRLIAKSDETIPELQARLASSGQQVEVVCENEAAGSEEPAGAIVLADEPESDRDARPASDEQDALSSETIVVEVHRHETSPALVEMQLAQAGVVIDSLDVLVHRLAIAFRQWTGKEPDLREMRESLEEFWNV
jgi:shikimate dehydrogenase